MKANVATVTIGISLFISGIAACTRGDGANRSPPQPTYSPIPTVIEPGLAYGAPCDPPCWRGLIPGQATRQEVNQVTEQLLASGWAKYVDKHPGGYIVYPLSVGATLERTIFTIFDNDTLKVVSGHVGFYYPIGDLVERFGNPEGLYLVFKGSTACRSCPEWDSFDPLEIVDGYSAYYLLYPSQGLFFTFFIPGSEAGCICPEMKTTYFCYYAPMTMQQALTDNRLADLCTEALEDVTEKDLVEWHGFGGGY